MRRNTLLTLLGGALAGAALYAWLAPRVRQAMLADTRSRDRDAGTAMPDDGVIANVESTESPATPGDDELRVGDNGDRPRHSRH